MEFSDLELSGPDIGTCVGVRVRLAGWRRVAVSLAILRSFRAFVAALGPFRDTLALAPPVRV